MNDAEIAAQRALAEDLAGYGDLTGRAFRGTGKARVEARAPGVLSGSAAFLATARLVDPAVDVRFTLSDGERFAGGETLALLDGPLASLFALERTGLNFLGRLSGVATLTAAFVAETAGTRARIAGTRKTTPGLRALEKAAIEHGGGSAHRFGLFDGAMIKDNHVAAAGGVREAVALVRDRLAHAHTLEVEVDTLEQLDQALSLGVSVILLDNMDVGQIREAVRRRDAVGAAGGVHALLEVSGGVQLEQVRELAATGVDVISVGALTTQAPWIDIALEFEGELRS